MNAPAFLSIPVLITLLAGCRPDESASDEVPDGTEEPDATEAPTGWDAPLPWGLQAPEEPPDCVRTAEETSWVVDGAQILGAVYLDEVPYAVTTGGLRRHDPGRPEALGPPGGHGLFAGPDGRLGIYFPTGVAWDVPGGAFDTLEPFYAGDPRDLRGDYGAIGILAGDPSEGPVSWLARDASGTTKTSTVDTAHQIAVAPDGSVLLGSGTDLWQPDQEPETVPATVRDLGWDGEAWVAVLSSGEVLRRGAEGWVEVVALADDPAQLWAFGEDLWVLST